MSYFLQTTLREYTANSRLLIECRPSKWIGDRKEWNKSTGSVLLVMEHVTCHESVAQDIEGVGLALVTFILSWRKCDKVCDWRSASHLIHAKWIWAPDVNWLCPPMDVYPYFLWILQSQCIQFDWKSEGDGEQLYADWPKKDHFLFLKWTIWSSGTTGCVSTMTFKFNRRYNIDCSFRALN